jgi:hypothetical protein
MKTVTLNGTTESLAATAKRYGLPRHTLINRLNYGWTLEQAVGLEHRPVQQGKTIEVNGQVFDSAKELAEAYDISATTLRSRLSKGLTPRQAVGLDYIDVGEKQYNPGWRVSVCGVSYATLADAARKLNVSYKTIVARMKRGWTIDEAFDATTRTPKHGYPGVAYRIDCEKTGKCYVGVTMTTLDERWEIHLRDAYDPNKRNGIGGIGEAIIAHGADAFMRTIIEHATNHVEMQSLEVKYIRELGTLKPNGYNLNRGGSGSMPNINHRITLNGQVFPSISMAIRQHQIDIPYQTIVQRLQDNWSSEQAFGFEPHETNTENWGRTQREIIVDGITYRSLAEACRQIPGAPEPKLAQNRLSNGWTPEEAFNLAPHDDQRGKHPHERDVLNSKATVRNTSGYRGVSKHQMTGKWQAAFSHKGKRIFVGLFDDVETANQALQNARQSVA